MSRVDLEQRVLFELDCEVNKGREGMVTSVRDLGVAQSPHFNLSGWLLETIGEPIHGVRAIIGNKIVVARRKQLRPDVMLKHPERPEAFYSGFCIGIPLHKGRNKLLLQYKDDMRKWQDFALCQIQLPFFWRLLKRFSARTPDTQYEKWYADHRILSSDQLEQQRKRVSEFTGMPLFSILVPVFNTPEKWLRRMIESVRAQTYPNWELCIADDRSTDPTVKSVLDSAAASDNRIKVVYRDNNGHICHASNSALELCTGEFVALLDHDDELTPDALFEVATNALKYPEADLFFSDEDKVDEYQKLSDPYFKMGFNADLLLQQNCFCHFGVFRSSLIKAIGGFRPGMEGSQDWDLILRALVKVGIGRVMHIPRVLYHWRTLATSTASSASAKPYAMFAGLRAVNDHLAVVAPLARVEMGADGAWQIIWPMPSPAPKVSIIMPTRNRLDLVRVSVESLFRVTEYDNFELILVDHQSDEPDILAYFEEIRSKHPGTKIPRVEGAFNWAKLNNIGVAEASGEIVLFLNNDVEINEPGWLREMVSQVCREGVGAVGACLFFPDGSIQHAGVVLNLAGIAGHVFRRARLAANSMGGPSKMVREVTAVTGACMAVRKEVFMKAGGFDQDKLPISYNDIDFCLRLRSMGYRNIYTPFARMVHHESVSRAALEKQSARKDAATEEARVVLSRWPDEFKQDAFYNPNLSRETEWPSLPGVSQSR